MKCILFLLPLFFIACNIIQEEPEDVGGAPSSTSEITCTEGGVVYEVGEVYQSATDCNSCKCNMYGASNCTSNYCHTLEPSSATENECGPEPDIELEVCSDWEILYKHYETNGCFEGRNWCRKLNRTTDEELRLAKDQWGKWKAFVESGAEYSYAAQYDHSMMSYGQRIGPYFYQYQGDSLVYFYNAYGEYGELMRDWHPDFKPMELGNEIIELAELEKKEFFRMDQLFTFIIETSEKMDTSSISGTVSSLLINDGIASIRVVYDEMYHYPKDIRINDQWEDNDAAFNYLVYDFSVGPNDPEVSLKELTFEECIDAQDNDSNGLIDCDDPSCAQWVSCGVDGA